MAFSTVEGWVESVPLGFGGADWIGEGGEFGDGDLRAALSLLVEVGVSARVPPVPAAWRTKFECVDEDMMP